MHAREARQCIVEKARSFLGLNERDGSHRRIIEIYNSHRPLPRGYAMRDSDPWCAAFVSAVAISCGLTQVLPPECSNEEMIALYRARGQWIEDDGYVPAPGDLVFFDWEDSGGGDSTGPADHVGIVTAVGGGRIRVVEGNAGDAVRYRDLPLDSRFIRGFCRPDYSLVHAFAPRARGAAI